MTSGRYVKEGLTWKTASAGLVGVLVLLGIAAIVLSRAQPTYPIDARVAETRVVGVAPECFWEVDVELRNDAGRDMRFNHIEMFDQPETFWAILGVLEADETALRTYRYPVADCAPPAVEQLTVNYGPVLSNTVRTVTFPVS